MRRDRANRRAKLKCQGTGGLAIYRARMANCVEMGGIVGGSHRMSAHSAGCVLESAMTEQSPTHSVQGVISLPKPQEVVQKMLSKIPPGEGRRQTKSRIHHSRLHILWRITLLICQHSGTRERRRHEFEEITMKN